MPCLVTQLVEEWACLMQNVFRCLVSLAAVTETLHRSSNDPQSLLSRVVLVCHACLVTQLVEEWACLMENVFRRLVSLNASHRDSYKSCPSYLIKACNRTPKQT